jgi:hypothetical protein
VQYFYNWLFRGVVCIVGGRGWYFTGRFHFKLHREYLFRGFLVRNARVVVYGGVLFRSLTVFIYLFIRSLLNGAVLSTELLCRGEWNDRMIIPVGIW